MDAESGKRHPDPMADGNVVHGGLGRLNDRLRSALATRVHVAGRRVLPWWAISMAERRRVHDLGLAELVAMGERGSLASVLTPEGVALGEILVMRGVVPMPVGAAPWE